MHIITISREFGSGGRELGKRLAELLGYDYYDKEIIDVIAQNKGLDKQYVSSLLENSGWANFPLTFRRTLSSAPSNAKIELLLEEKRVIEEIARLGKNCIIVGRSADVLLRKYQPFNIFVCADMQSRIKRCLERAGSDEQPSEKEMLRKIQSIDKSRMRARALIGGNTWGNRENYHLTVNTSGWTIKDLAAAVQEYYIVFLGRSK